MNHSNRNFRVLIAAPVLLAVFGSAHRAAVAQSPVASTAGLPLLAQYQPTQPAQYQPRGAGAPQYGAPSQYASPPQYGSPYGASEPAARVAAAPGTTSGSGPGNSTGGQSGSSGSLIPAAADAEVASTEAVESEGTAGNSLVKRLLQGGILMLPLAVCSLVVFALAVERSVALRRGRVIPRPFVRRFTECVQDGQLSYDEALEICDEFDCPVAEVFHATVKRWGRPTVEVEQAVMDAGERVADGLRRYLRLFHAVSNVAPLLGLLGTVLGMIEAFESLGSAGSGPPADMLASGISQALITTAAGLSVAIPAYLAYIYFSARADRYLVEIDGLCQRVVDSISAEGLQAGATKGSAKRTKRAA